MGWKNVKEHYRIEHIVQVNERGICIGSPYISGIIVIGMDGKIKKRYDGSGRNENLLRYQSEFDADLDKLQTLVKSADSFSKGIIVYTYDEESIIEKLCEIPGWPNVTHDGEIMYENTFSVDKAKVVKWAKKNAKAGIDIFMRQISDTKNQLLKEFRRLKKAKNDLEKLNTKYPENQ